MDALYVKQDGVLTKLDLGGGSSPGGVVSVSRQTTVLESTLPAGSEISALALVSTESGADLAAPSAAVNGKLDASVYEAEKKEAMQ